MSVQAKDIFLVLLQIVYTRAKKRPTLPAAIILHFFGPILLIRDRRETLDQN